MLRAILKHVPSWNMFHIMMIGIVCRSEKVPFWNIRPIGAVQTLSYLGQTTMMSFLLITFKVALQP